jgi:hypothetical protein
MKMLTSIRRLVFTYRDEHSVIGCHRYYLLLGIEMCRFRSSCPHNIVVDLKMRKLVICL